VLTPSRLARRCAPSCPCPPRVRIGARPRRRGLRKRAHPSHRRRRLGLPARRARRSGHTPTPQSAPRSRSDAYSPSSRALSQARRRRRTRARKPGRAAFANVPPVLIGELQQPRRPTPLRLLCRVPTLHPPRACPRLAPALAWFGELTQHAECGRLCDTHPPLLRNRCNARSLRRASAVLHVRQSHVLTCPPRHPSAACPTRYLRRCVCTVHVVCCPRSAIARLRPAVPASRRRPRAYPRRKGAGASGVACAPDVSALSIHVPVLAVSTAALGRWMAAVKKRVEAEKWLN
jgi:hypothetical protein